MGDDPDECLLRVNHYPFIRRRRRITSEMSKTGRKDGTVERLQFSRIVWCYITSLTADAGAPECRL